MHWFHYYVVHYPLDLKRNEKKCAGEWLTEDEVTAGNLVRSESATNHKGCPVIKHISNRAFVAATTYPTSCRRPSRLSQTIAQGAKLDTGAATVSLADDEQTRAKDNGVNIAADAKQTLNNFFIK
ncbi:unnamed protein product [Caenorhabditis auriculariae]|uniref:Uncharacterized protein n=1 Tax=Caenorhabditis auriculariae TaxID=2777116 RepID=A0A8S1GXC4_9PELO|nr:unnamed protein product [Caenorhabditis auriculariae]